MDGLHHHSSSVDSFLDTIDLLDDDLARYHGDEAAALQQQQLSAHQRALSGVDDFLQSLHGDDFLKKLSGILSQSSLQSAAAGLGLPAPVVSSNVVSGSGNAEWPPAPAPTPAAGFDQLELPSQAPSQDSSPQLQQQLQQPPLSQLLANPLQLQQMVMMQNQAAMLCGSVPAYVKPARSSDASRKLCSRPGCPNRVVQGGLCISHGARRKKCGFPGCDKNVKKAGMCSAHGPARKRCQFVADAGGPPCERVAVLGGLCVAHGARKPRCQYSGGGVCDRQAIRGGMCKRHHDEVNGVARLRAVAGRRKTG